MQGECGNAFVAVRPPGHHATAENAMGFCLFNNVAVAARYAQNKYKESTASRSSIGTSTTATERREFFTLTRHFHFFSMHQYPWYPGTGHAERRARTRAGTTLNVPVEANTKAGEQLGIRSGDRRYSSQRFKPDLIFISAGFDAHLDDPLGQLQLEDSDFVSMTRTVKEWADEVCDGRVVSCLEGGYNLETLGETVKEPRPELAALSLTLAAVCDKISGTR